ncbi:hypothetical protein [Luteibacter yeojuensis]|uniref:Uncharacterized protein n=1 Tax=Luteibacter yeojuensis TaxID=345309 RepID=A0A0F3KMU7_9GAMM|nr:hypothetical protein [Luteibacter yeojuensis]KJV32528.1 hypothetical protein VI08_12405 [Luteibacter yeojuensis]
MIVWVMSALLSSADADPPRTVPNVSTLNANRESFSGQEVTVKGYLWIGPEQLYIVDRRFYSDDGWKRASGCLSLVNVGDIDKEAGLSGKLVEITGTFVTDNITYGISLMVCGETGIDLHGAPGTAIKAIVPKRKKK